MRRHVARSTRSPRSARLMRAAPARVRRIRPFRLPNQKKPRAGSTGFSYCKVCSLIERSGGDFNARSLGTFRPLSDFELNPLTFLQAAKALGVDC